uniref:Uncharacterized protein n=1 Tax=Rhizophagus irregularis (strain DAOM 181602 / DAOM 197198 / MUCL 43194) TaxID=747089 RepID=U9UTT0_RHIID
MDPEKIESPEDTRLPIADHGFDDSTKVQMEATDNEDEKNKEKHRESIDLIIRRKSLLSRSSKMLKDIIEKGIDRVIPEGGVRIEHEVNEKEWFLERYEYEDHIKVNLQYHYRDYQNLDQNF